MFPLVEKSFDPDPWRWQPHPEVWLLVIALVAAFVHAVRNIGPRVMPPGEVVTRRQVAAFSAGMLLLWLASDWPMHDIAEEYLYSVHMVQHMVLTYVVPPLALLATPEWLFRLVVGDGRVYRAVRFLSRPVAAILIYTAMVLVTHVPAVVNVSASTGPVHYLVHVAVVLSSLLMWMPICGPAPEMQVPYLGKMVYLFSLSFSTLVPSGWLTFADKAVYEHYDTPVRVGGISVISDQQGAAAIMKIGGTLYIWPIIIFIFFRRFMRGFHQAQNYQRVPSAPAER